MQRRMGRAIRHDAQAARTSRSRRAVRQGRGTRRADWHSSIARTGVGGAGPLRSQVHAWQLLLPEHRRGRRDSSRLHQLFPVRHLRQIPEDATGATRSGRRMDRLLAWPPRRRLRKRDGPYRVAQGEAKLLLQSQLLDLGRPRRALAARDGRAVRRRQILLGVRLPASGSRRQLYRGSRGAGAQTAPRRTREGDGRERDEGLQVRAARLKRAAQKSPTPKKPPRRSSDVATLRRIAFSFPGVEEGSSYGPLA